MHNKDFDLQKISMISVEGYIVAAWLTVVHNVRVQYLVKEALENPDEMIALKDGFKKCTLFNRMLDLALKGP